MVMRLSVVVPCFNEEPVLEQLRESLTEVLSRIVMDFEVLLVDDGSTDKSLAVMRNIVSDDPRFRYIALSRNFGKEAAMLAGLSQATGDAVVIMDADLQHPPELLERLVRLLGAGYDQVVARRTRTGDGRLRTLVARLYYRVINKLVDVQLTDGAGDFRVLSRRAVDALLALGECNRFSKGLFSWIGFDTATVDYDNVARRHGRSTWSLRGLLNYGIDGVVSFNNRPLRLAIYFGLFVTLMAFGYTGWVVIDAIATGVDVPGYVTLVCSVSGLGGLQLIFLGVIGEYLGRIYYETKRRPHFLVKEASDGKAMTAAVTLGSRISGHAMANATEHMGQPLR
jgi:glycosyltransferase involved in cell wall biosynthesis